MRVETRRLRLPTPRGRCGGDARGKEGDPGSEGEIQGWKARLHSVPLGVRRDRAQYPAPLSPIPVPAYESGGSAKETKHRLHS